MTNEEQLSQWGEENAPYRAMKHALDALKGVPAGDQKLDAAYMALREAYFAPSGMTSANEAEYPAR